MVEQVASLRPENLIHGSDYPVPPSAWSALHHLGWSRTRKLSRIWSYLERDVRIKRELGFPDSVFQNAGRVLRLKPL